jgi:hypothetical protein
MEDRMFFIVGLVIISVCSFCIAYSITLSRQLTRCRQGFYGVECSLYQEINELMTENHAMSWRLYAWETYAKGDTIGFMGYFLPTNKLSLEDVYFLTTTKNTDEVHALIKEKYESYLNEAKA